MRPRNLPAVAKVEGKLMDWADAAVARQGREGILRADPLKGIDLETEYKLIKAEISPRPERIQRMIIDRVEKGI